jgi:mRNA interferase MazF
MNLVRGAVILVALDPTVGHEQRGTRPCIVISNQAVNEDQRYPLIAVVPVTGTAGEGALYPRLSPGHSGLSKNSYALVDQVRTIDKRRVRRLFGQLPEAELAAIDQGLELFLDLCHHT